MNVLALSNVVFASGGTTDQFGGNFGHLTRSDEDAAKEEGKDQVVEVAPLTNPKAHKNKLMSSQYSNLLEGSSENFAGLERQQQQ